MTNLNTEYFKENGIDFLQFQFTTIFGELRMVEFPAQNWEEMKNGTGVDGSSLGFLATEQSDMRAVPELSTFTQIPWNPSVGCFFCNLQDNDGNPYPTCPRGILKGVLQQAKELGYFMSVRPELEWYFLNNDLEASDYGEYMATNPNDSLQELRRIIAEDMIEMFPVGIPHTFHHEVGPGQQEVELAKLSALPQADNVQLGKMICKTEAQLQDYIATFMPKPFSDEAGSGLHLHLYLEDQTGKNVFSTEGGVSDTLKYFIGGVMHHVDALSAILNPSTNSYARLTPHHEAPVYKSWGLANRTALVRVPGYDSKAHIEYRASDASMNIYLGMAVLLAAGLDGIKHKRMPNTATTKNVDKLTDDERQELGIEQLPESLEDALDAFEKSDFITKFLGEELKAIILEKKRAEWTEYEIQYRNGYQDEWETNTYLDC